MLYDNKKVSLLATRMRDTQTMQQQIQEQYLAKSFSPTLGSMEVGGQSGPIFIDQTELNVELINGGPVTRSFRTPPVCRLQ
jgi:hypothetical protein